MKLIVHKRAFLHYILIYLMLLWHDAGLKIMFGTTNFEYLTLGIAIIFIFFYRRCRSRWAFGFSAAIATNILFVRYFIGGVGIVYLFKCMSGILLTAVAVNYDRSFFVERYVKVVTFFAGTSVVLWMVTLVAPQLYKQMTILTYSIYSQKTYISAVDFIATPIKFYGALLYVFREGIDTVRNNGIFNEPGLYQIVLNSALYLTLFFPDLISNDKKRIRRYSLILLVTVITCQSTTGYLSLFAILLLFILKRQKKKKNNIIAIIVVAIGILFADTVMNGQSSFFMSTIGSKISITNQGVSFVGSGKYRAETTTISLLSLLKNPLGIGMDRYDVLLAMAGKTSSDGNALMLTGATMGIQMWLILILFVAVPMYRQSQSKMEFFTLLFVYINVTMGQSNVFYPGLLILTTNFHLIKKTTIINKAK